MSFLPSTGTMAVVFTAVPVGLVAAFIAMNPAGFLAMLAASGAFILAALIGLVNMGFAGIYYVAQMLVTAVANASIGLLNVVVAALNGAFQAMLNALKAIGINASFSLMPSLQYLTPPHGPQTINQIIQGIQNSFGQVSQAYGSYWSGVQANAPGSYAVGGLAGVGAGGASSLATSHTQESTHYRQGNNYRSKSSSKSSSGSEGSSSNSSDKSKSGGSGGSNGSSSDNSSSKSSSKSNSSSGGSSSGGSGSKNGGNSGSKKSKKTKRRSRVGGWRRRNRRLPV